MTPAAVNSAAVRGSTAVRSPVPGLGVSEEEPLGAREESSPAWESLPSELGVLLVSELDGAGGVSVSYTRSSLLKERAMSVSAVPKVKFTDQSTRFSGFSVPAFAAASQVLSRATIS